MRHDAKQPKLEEQRECLNRVINRGTEVNNAQEQRLVPFTRQWEKVKQAESDVTSEKRCYPGMSVVKSRGDRPVEHMQ